MRRLFSIGHSGSSSARRVVGLLLALWALGAADYLFTVWAQRFTPFEEVNPWASSLLHHHHFTSLAITKVLLMGLATVIFWRLRHRMVTQAALWGLVLVHVGLMMQWSSYTVVTLEMSRTTQILPDGRVATINYLPPVLSTSTLSAGNEPPALVGVDQPAPGAPARDWQLALLPVHGRE